MRKVLFLFTWLLCTVCMAVQAQPPQSEYRPFAVDEKIWDNQVGGTMENVYGHFVDGDTLINGENWKKVTNYVGRQTYNNAYYAAIRDVDRKVYAIAKNSSRPRLLYDFSLKVGETVRCGIEGNAFGCLLDAGEEPDTLFGFRFVSRLVLERIDTVRSQGLSHRRFTFTLSDSFGEPYVGAGKVVWIEGVGSAAGPFQPWMPLPPKGSFIWSCDIGRTYLFSYPDYYTSYDISAVCETRSDTSGNNAFFNLQGLLLLSQPRKGVYIQDGRKVLK